MSKPKMCPHGCHTYLVKVIGRLWCPYCYRFADAVVSQDGGER